MNKKGQIAATITVGMVIAVIALISVIFLGAGLLLTFVKNYLIGMLGGFLIVIALIISLRTGKFNKATFWILGIGLAMIILNIILKVNGISLAIGGA